MSYQITTKDGITVRNIPDDVAPDSPELRQKVASIRSGQQEQAMFSPPQAGPVAEPPPQIAPQPAAETTAGGIGGALTRGLGPAAAATTLGAGIGSIVPGIGTVIGGAAGLGAYGLTELLGPYIVAGANRLLGTKFDEPTKAVEHILTTAGVEKPDTPLERIVQSGSSQAAGAAGLAALGSTVVRTAAGPVTRAVGSALAAEAPAQLVSGATSGAAQQGAAELGAGPLGQAAAGFAGGLAGYKVAAPRAPIAPKVEAPATAEEVGQLARLAASAGPDSKAAQKLAGAVGGIDEQAVQSYEALGMTPYLQADHVSTNQSFRELSQLVKSRPGSVGHARDLAAVSELAKRADETIAKLGGARDISHISDEVKTQLRTTQQQLEQKADDLYGRLRQAIPSKAEAPADSVLSFIRGRADELGGESNLSGPERMVLRKLSPREGKQPTYALLDDVRRDLTAARLKRQGPFKDAESGLVKKLESELMTDQRAVVDRYGQGQLFDEARQTVAVRKGLEDDLSALFGRQLDENFVSKLSTAVGALPAGDSAKLTKLIETVPKELRQRVVASGLSAAFNRSARDGQLSLKHYNQWFEGLIRNRQAKAVLFSHLPDGAATGLEHLYNVSKALDRSVSLYSHTGKSLFETVVGKGRVVERLIDATKAGAKEAFVAGAIGTPLGAGAPAAGVAFLRKAVTHFVSAKKDARDAIDQLISSDDFLRFVRAGQPDVEKLARSPALSAFFRRIRQPLSPEQRARWLLDSMQSEPPSQEQPAEWKPNFGPNDLKPTGQRAADGRPILRNKDGSVSTEFTVTVEDDRLNGGRPTVIPTIYDGREVSPDRAIQIVAANGGKDPDTGIYQPGFGSIDEADRFAQRRHNSNGNWWRTQEQP